MIVALTFAAMVLLIVVMVPVIAVTAILMEAALASVGAWLAEKTPPMLSAILLITAVAWIAAVLTTVVLT